MPFTDSPKDWTWFIAFGHDGCGFADMPGLNGSTITKIVMPIARTHLLLAAIRLECMR